MGGVGWGSEWDGVQGGTGFRVEQGLGWDWGQGGTGFRVGLGSRWDGVQGRKGFRVGRGQMVPYLKCAYLYIFNYKNS